MTLDPYILARNAIEDIVPQICAQSGTEKVGELETKLKELLPLTDFFIVGEIFSNDECQIYFYLKKHPLRELAIRMVKVGHTWLPAIPRRKEAGRESSINNP